MAGRPRNLRALGALADDPLYHGIHGLGQQMTTRKPLDIALDAGYARKAKKANEKVCYFTLTDGDLRSLIDANGTPELDVHGYCDVIRIRNGLSKAHNYELQALRDMTGEEIAMNLPENKRERYYNAVEYGD